MTILEYITANPNRSGSEIAAALNIPTTTVNAELRRLWRNGSVIREERKTGGRFSYQVNPMPFGCAN
ncbi:winged helix-turn-helix domain-containing protein, partial [Escherichia coli]